MADSDNRRYLPRAFSLLFMAGLLADNAVRIEGTLYQEPNVNRVGIEGRWGYFSDGVMNAIPNEWTDYNDALQLRAQLELSDAKAATLDKHLAEVLNRQVAL